VVVLVSVKEQMVEQVDQVVEEVQEVLVVEQVIPLLQVLLKEIMVALVLLHQAVELEVVALVEQVDVDNQMVVVVVELVLQLKLQQIQ
jgi:hypothetical protein